MNQNVDCKQDSKPWNKNLRPSHQYYFLLKTSKINAAAAAAAAVKIQGKKKSRSQATLLEFNNRQGKEGEKCKRAKRREGRSDGERVFD